MRDGQCANSQNPRQHNQNGDNPGKDRAANKKARKHQALPPLA
ncbi:Hypothetical protein c1763 [Escherichia coli CFT073]|uniref:Uncharacterized protein n=1 Tax=Escherichia coli O6:H1 (strain CFT073 / ATCC 700928 / UPEC) TaxID=199310 RepID=A0A0H2V879_ECOL6|nr:Hypothetical protein c1763 [Escherichia coli CFT073]